MVFWLIVGCLVVFVVFATISLSFFAMFYLLTKNMVVSVIGQILCSALAVYAGRQYTNK